MNNETEKSIHQFKARLQIEAAKRGWTMSKLAKNLGRTPQALSDLIRQNNPRLDTLFEIAQRLEMTIEEFNEPVDAQEYGEALLPRV